jgi:WD40 repeat protein
VTILRFDKMKLILQVLLVSFLFQFNRLYADSIHIQYPALHHGAISTIILSPDETKLLTSSDDGTIKLWEVSTGSLLISINSICDKSETATLSFSPDGLKFIVCPMYSPSAVVETQSGKTLYALEQTRKDSPHPNYKSKFIWSPDGNKILSFINVKNKIASIARIFDSHLGNPIFDFFDSTRRINRIEFSPDGNLFLVAFSDNQFVIFHSLNHREVYKKNGEIFANFNKSGSQYITETGKIFDSHSGALLKVLSGNSSCYRYIEFLPGDTSVILLCKNGISIQDIRTGNMLKSFEGFNFDGDCHNESFPNDFLSVHEKFLFLAISADTIKQWDLKTGEFIQCFNDTSYCSDFQLSQSGKFIYTSYEKYSTYENHIKIWSTESGDLIHRFRLTNNGQNWLKTKSETISDIFLDKENLRLNILCKDKRVTQIDFAKGKIKRNKLIKSKRFSNDRFCSYRKNDSISIYLKIDHDQIILSNQIGTKIGYIVLRGKKDWLIYDSKENYDASRGMSKKIYFVANNKISHSMEFKRQYRKKNFWKDFAFM